MRFTRTLTALAVAAALTAPLAHAKDALPASTSLDAPTPVQFPADVVTPPVAAKLKAQFPDLPIIQVAKDDTSGLYLVRLIDGSLLYTNEAATFIIANTDQRQPQLFNIADGQVSNATEVLSRPFNLAMLSEVSDTVDFKAANEQFVVTAFIDPACGYCNVMHKEIQAYNDAGITIRYVAFPIFGDNSEQGLARIMALPEAERGEKLTALKTFMATTKGQTPDWDALGLPDASDAVVARVQSTREIAGKLGFGGTPGLVLPSGETLNGYVPAANLLEVLKNSAQR